MVIVDIKSKFRQKILLSIIFLSLLGIFIIYLVSNNVIRSTIYENVTQLAQIQQEQHAREIEDWFVTTEQTLRNLVTALYSTEGDDHVYLLAEAFILDNPNLFSNVFIGFADGYIIRGNNWVGAEHLRSYERPWFIPAYEAGADVIITTEPFVTTVNGRRVVAISTWVDDIGCECRPGQGAVVSLIVPIDQLIQQIHNHPVMSNGHLILITDDGYVLVHPDETYHPTQGEARLTHLSYTPDGQEMLKNIELGNSFVPFNDYLLGTSYFIKVPLRIVDWTLITIIPNTVMTNMMWNNLFPIILVLSIVIMVISVFMVLIVLFFTRRLDESNIVANRLRNVINHMPLSAHVFDKKSNIIVCNDIAPKIFGLQSSDEFIARYKYLSPSSQPDGSLSELKSKAYIKEAFDKGYCVYEWNYQTAFGKEFPSKVTVSKVTWDGDDALLFFIDDITISHEYMKEKQHTQERLQILLDASPVACGIANDSFQIIDLNKAALKLFEMTDKDYILRNFYDFSPKYQHDGRVSSEKMLIHAQSTFRTGRSDFKWLFQNSSGEEILCKVTFVKATIAGEDVIIAYAEDLRRLEELQQMVDDVTKRVNTDALTGAFSRLYFTNTATEMLKKCIEENEDFSVIYYDVDFFKKVNDNYGHGVGDEVLKIAVARAKNTLKKDTVLARYGGEEFIIVLPYNSLENAEKTAWRIQHTITESPFTIGELSLNITISFGVASKKDTDTIDDLDVIIDRADQALYKAKNSGRNTVVCYQEDL